jgi:hypothetical protein
MEEMEMMETAAVMATAETVTAAARMTEKASAAATVMMVVEGAAMVAANGRDGDGGSGNDREGSCKGTSVCFLTSPILSHSPPVHMYSPSSPLYYLQGLYLKPMTSRPDGPTTFQKSTH